MTTDSLFSNATEDEEEPLLGLALLIIPDLLDVTENPGIDIDDWNDDVAFVTDFLEDHDLEEIVRLRVNDGKITFEHTPEIEQFHRDYE